MIKVLHKSLAVLEYIALRQQPVSATETARALEIPHPTCIRILKELTELGYLEQSGFRKGYRLGPIPFRISSGRDDDRPFLERAEQEIRDCARQLGQSILLSTRHGSWRTIRCCSNFNPDFHFPPSQLRHHDLYWTCSGRVLLAHATAREVDEFIAANGLPAAVRGTLLYWPEAAGNSARLKRELNDVRVRGFAELKVGNCGHTHCFAVPVFRNGRFFGALAANWPLDSGEEFDGECRDAVFELADRLSCRDVRKAIVG